MPRRFSCFVLAIACSLVLAGAAGANPAPAFSDLAQANDYGHVNVTQVGNQFNFTVCNDQLGAGQTIAGWAFYPTVQLFGAVPVNNLPTPVGWSSVGWEGPVTGILSPALGLDGRDSFTSNSSIFNIAPGACLGGFSVQWIGPSLPNPPDETLFKYGLLVSRPGQTFWAEAGPNPCLPPIPDASTLVLAASGAVMGLPMLRRHIRKRAA